MSKPLRSAAAVTAVAAARKTSVAAADDWNNGSEVGPTIYSVPLATIHKARPFIHVSSSKLLFSMGFNHHL